MPRTRLTALSILLGAVLLAPLGVRAQSSSSTYIVGEGNESILEKHLLNGVLVGNNNVTQTSADLLSAFTAFGSNNAIDTAAIVFGNNNSQVTTTDGMASASVQVGRGNAIRGETNNQVGQNNTTAGSTNTTIGMGNEIEGNQNLITGILVTTKGSGNAVTGWGGQVVGDNNTRIGTVGSINGNNNVTFGNSVEVTGSNQVVGGTSARGFADGCVALGSGSQCFESDEFSVGLTNNERRVTNVADGRRYTDAANVGQVLSVVRTLGAGADIVNGAVIPPFFEFRGGAAYDNVADAMYDLDGRIAKLEDMPPSSPGPQGPPGPAGQDGKDGIGGSALTSGKNIEVSTNLDGSTTVALSDDVRLSERGAVTAGSTTLDDRGLTIQGGPSVTAAGIDANSRRVTNVADGRIERGSADAVNGGQLYEVQQVWDDRWSETDRRFRHQDRRMNALGAQMGAMTQAATAAAQNGGAAIGQVNFNAGLGFSGGEAALSIGWGARVSQRTSVSAGVSFGSGNKPVAGFGLSINLGR